MLAKRLALVMGKQCFLRPNLAEKLLITEPLTQCSLATPTGQLYTAAIDDDITQAQWHSG